MQLGIRFFVSSILLGIGLAMDAFSVSVANGLNEPNMRKSRVALISGTFAMFQGVMPLIGWFIVVTAVGALDVLDQFVPWIALILLAFIGGKMIKDGIGSFSGEYEDNDAAVLVTNPLDGMTLTENTNPCPWG